MAYHVQSHLALLVWEKEGIRESTPSGVPVEAEQGECGDDASRGHGGFTDGLATDTSLSASFAPGELGAAVLGKGDEAAGAHYSTGEEGSSRIEPFSFGSFLLHSPFYPLCLSSSLSTYTISAASCFAETTERRGGTHVYKNLLLLVRRFPCANVYRELPVCQVPGQELYVEYLSTSYNNTER